MRVKALRYLPALAIAVAAAAPYARAATPAELLAGYADKPAPRRPRRGRQFFTSRHGREWSCGSCHGACRRRAGKHASTGKPIAPSRRPSMPSASPIPRAPRSGSAATATTWSAANALPPRRPTCWLAADAQALRRTVHLHAPSSSPALRGARRQQPGRRAGHERRHAAARPALLARSTSRNAPPAMSPTRPACCRRPRGSASMSDLPHHFGTDASLDAARPSELSAWLANDAAPARRAREPPPEDRITRSAWFVRKHERCPPSPGSCPAVKSASNCCRLPRAGRTRRLR